MGGFARNVFCGFANHIGGGTGGFSRLINGLLRGLGGPGCF
jgi:hypothetical protein